MARDPVCGMDVMPEEAAGTSRYKGVDYYFCAVSCKEAFDRSPMRYVDGAPPSEATSQAVEVAPPLTRGAGPARRIEIPIRGMSCASCVAKIESGLSKLSGVEKVSVNFATEQVAVVYRPDIVTDRKSTRLNSSHIQKSRMPSSA